MPRPSDVTEEQIAKWQERYKQTKKPHITFNPPEEISREVYFAGHWLHNKLLELHCPEELANQICGAAAQWMWLKRDDVWQVAQEKLEDYKNGKWEEPGRELAEKIMKEFFDGNPTKEKAREFILQMLGRIPSHVELVKLKEQAKAELEEMEKSFKKGSVKEGDEKERK